MKASLYLVFLLIICLINLLRADVRFVSKSGASVPPFLSWSTAADSIQKCLNICDNGDTIYVGIGVYHESLIINKEITLIGLSMDSTVIDGSGLNINTIYIETPTKLNIMNFTLYGRDLDSATVIRTKNILNINSCKIQNGHQGIRTLGGGIVNNVFITNCGTGYSGGACPLDTCNHNVKNSIICTDAYHAYGITTSLASYYKIYNNIIIYDGSDISQVGIYAYIPQYIEIKNNIVSGFDLGMWANAIDTSFVYNNVIDHSGTAISMNSRIKIKNCIIKDNYLGIESTDNRVIDYNLFLNNLRNGDAHITLGTHTLYSDPMFVNDSKPDSTFSFDYHLQKYSPAIDKGDPTILDKDGTISDLGYAGGPLGETYTYQDLAPRAPRNVTAYVYNQKVFLQWYKNTEADTAYYNIYRDTVPNFTIDSTKLISRQKDTLFTETLPKNTITLYYKLTAEDKEGNISEPSEEKVITYTSSEEKYEVVESYQLFQNYPNPFNPSTTISYRLKERGYVKLLVYDIKGETIKVLVNKEQESGYYETEFDATGLASGIYIYRIEVIGKGKIPIFSDMKKTILLK